MTEHTCVKLHEDLKSFLSMALRNSLTVFLVVFFGWVFFSDFIINMFLTKKLRLSNNKIMKYIYSYKFKFRDNSVSSLKMVS